MKTVSTNFLLIFFIQSVCSYLIANETAFLKFLELTSNFSSQNSSSISIKIAKILDPMHFILSILEASENQFQ